MYESKKMQIVSDSDYGISRSSKSRLWIYAWTWKINAHRTTFEITVSNFHDALFWAIELKLRFWTTQRYKNLILNYFVTSRGDRPLFHTAPYMAIFPAETISLKQSLAFSVHPSLSLSLSLSFFLFFSLFLLYVSLFVFFVFAHSSSVSVFAGVADMSRYASQSAMAYFCRIIQWSGTGSDLEYFYDNTIQTKALSESCNFLSTLFAQPQKLFYCSAGRVEIPPTAHQAQKPPLVVHERSVELVIYRIDCITVDLLGACWASPSSLWAWNGSCSVCGAETSCLKNLLRAFSASYPYRRLCHR